MSDNFDLQNYLIEGVERIVSEAVRTTLKDPRESAFLLKFAAATRLASKKRRKSEDKGEHIPSFLIASITSRCNLHCSGCYSRCTGATDDTEPTDQLTDSEWLRIFDEADDIGISFIILAGGEPLMRRDIIEAAGKKQNIMFPVFTNGVCINEKYFTLFDKCRNLVPIMSIEGNKEKTDERRGKGVYDKLVANMDKFRERGLIFGASVTVTTRNYREIASSEFLKDLSDRGCKAVIYVEYVPVTEESRGLAPGDNEREYLDNRLRELRDELPGMMYVSFPGDEKSSGGCFAAGRGFFHINSHGGAEPCPFSPYSDVNVKNSSLHEALRSPLFTALRSGDILNYEHEGGCVLYEKRALVEELVKKPQQTN